MGWHNGYYYRKERVHGKTIELYCGNGLRGLIAASVDEHRRQQRKLERKALAELVVELQALETFMIEVDRIYKERIAEMMHAAGYHRLKGGPWRKRRTPKLPPADA